MGTTGSVLIVDDDPDNLEMVAAYLQLRGFTVATAQRGPEALTLAFASPPQVVLMDVGMPDMDGWEATRQLKADRRTKDAVILAVTGYAVAAYEAKSMEVGADGFVAKPFDIEALAAVIANILRTGRIANTARPIAPFLPTV
jgi:CheY-like chemotaxis protein